MVTTTWLSVSHTCKTNSLLLPGAPSFSSLCKFHSKCKPFSRKSQPHLSLGLMIRIGGFPVSALKKQTDSGDEVDGFLDDGDDEDEEGMVLPLQKMKEWLQKKPHGFGRGKEYDTSIEDNLLQQIEQSRVAQAANLNKLKNNDSASASPNSSFNNILLHKNASEIINTGVRVRIVNLPKKKNIDRDLRMAFKEFPGIVNIIPAVVGNKKTRDPICKGFAFVDFKSEGDAKRFLQAFSRQNLMFGKIQKQITCEMVNEPTFSSAHEISAINTKDVPRLMFRDESEQVSDSDMDDSSLEETAVDNYNDFADETIRTGMEDIEENLASATELHSDDSLKEVNSDDGDNAELRTKSETRSVEKTHLLEKRPNSKEREEVPKKMLPVKGKKKVSKQKQLKEKGGKKPVIEIPGSAKRLKIKEKAVLTDVYSRYGTKSALVSKGGN